MSSESDVESVSDLKADESQLSEFLQNFSPISLNYRKPESRYRSWLFWSEYEGCENNPSSADVGTPIIHDMIKSAFYNFHDYWSVGQFWEPVTIGGRRLLSTSAQPFSVGHLSNKFAKYRLNSVKYRYNIDDANKFDIEPDQMIKSGGPAAAFLNCQTSMSKIQGFLSEADDYGGLNFSAMFPICFPPQSNYCIGVLEFTFVHSYHQLMYFIYDTVKAIKNAGLDVFNVQHLIPYKTINGLKLVKDEIEEALKVVCASNNLALAQVWIPYENKNNVPFSYSLEDIQTKELSAIKLTGYLNDDTFESYLTMGDVTPHAIGEEPTVVTLQDYESHYISTLPNCFRSWVGLYHGISAFAICLRSNVTGDLNYAFEFLWAKHPNYAIFLEAILLTLKRCLPRFKFASGAELGDELDVILVESSTNDHGKGETQKFKIFQGKRSSPMPKEPEIGKKPMVVDAIAPSKAKFKTSPKVLSPQDIEKQFGKTMKEAAENLNVSVSTLKRKCKDLGIPEWQGPSFVKRNTNSSSLIQSSTNEEDDGAIEGTSTVNLNKNVLTLKAKYTDYMIKLHLPISQATFATVEKRIGMKLNLSVGTFKLEYIDEDEDWISLTSDTDMNDCIKSSRKSDPIVARLRVLPSPQPISGPSGSLETFFM